MGLVFFTISLIPLLKNSSEKRVVSMASMLGDLRYTANRPELHFSSYSATKAAVTMANAKFHVECVDSLNTFVLALTLYCSQVPE